MIGISSAFHAETWLLLSFVLLPFAISGENACPDGSTCTEGKECCPQSFGRYGCCNIWHNLMKEINEAGQQHVMGAPSMFVQNSSSNYQSCYCPRGTCCGMYCCPLRGAQCCAYPSLCCGSGMRCCGNGQWCCKRKQFCSAAYGYCLNTASTIVGSLTTALIMVFTSATYFQYSVSH
ncbi:progranulin-like isoform X1 [Stegodyphus dumicola]|uniref:progranulin-like isoform X1 n=1 Tax=Stegodyphus dumicola TaxID=202533 RepID=UPI0015AF28BA|nr:progranulin-like isoform X1 [Stegodyphus dumicola]